MTTLLDLTERPSQGSNLIEASAGTGKTYSISNLYLHYVLQGKSVSEILVVTFTELATKELKDRIRLNLSLALQVSKGIKEDSLIQTILSLYPGKAVYLKSALLNFDQAAIFTIHGFCQRLLTESAFESGRLFDVELVKDSTPIINEIVNDYWRSKVFTLSELENSFFKLKRDNFVSLCKTVFNHPDIQVTESFHSGDYEGKLHQYVQLKLKQKEWINISVKILGMLKNEDKTIQSILHDGSLKGNIYKPADWNKKVTILKDQLNKLSSLEELKLILDYFGPKIRTAVKKDQVAPSHKLFEECESLKDQVDELAMLEEELGKLINLRMKVEFFTWISEKMEDIRSRNNIMIFSDLITDLHSALKSEANDGPLHLKVRDKFKVALVDEFQDTDPLQYEIFNTLFGETNQEASFFMIGDPKQSIYSFRGADIFSYLEAKKDSNEFTLNANYRSEEGMVKAVNEFFLSKGAEDCFAYAPREETQGKGIVFEDVLSKGEVRKLVLKDGSEPLQLRWYENSESLKSESFANTSHFFDQAVCSDIVELLNQSELGDAYFVKDGSKKSSLKPGDIAILVNTHKEAFRIKKLLTKHHVASVVYKSGHLFETQEAKDLLRLLIAIEDPNDRTMMPLLLSAFLKETAVSLSERNDSDKYQFLLELLDYQNNWNRRGVYRTVQKFIEKHQYGVSVLSQKNGERQYSNMMQLCDILHVNELEEGGGLVKLIDFLSKKIHTERDEEELYLQQLETDVDAVQILTIHSSKGLEFPIVFCPYLFSKSFVESKSKDFYFSELKEGQVKKLYEISHGTDDSERHSRLKRREVLGEQLRLCYVALTRSVNRCYLYWGRLTPKPNVYNFLASTNMSGEDILKKDKSQIKFDEARNMAHWADTLGSHADIKFSKFHQEEIKPLIYKDKVGSDLVRPKAYPNVSNSWKVGSYSSLSRTYSDISFVPEEKVHQSDEEYVIAPVDEYELQEQVPAKGFYKFPRGSNPGTAIHEMFENIDFCDSSEWLEVIQSKLMRFDLDGGSKDTDNAILKERQSACFEMMSSMVQADLLPEHLQSETNFCLQEISRAQRIDEMEFYYVIKNMSKHDLVKVFEKHYPEDHENFVFARDLNGLNFDMDDGILTGSIDLIFEKEGQYYILDWKSNHLGNEATLYGKETLKYEVRHSYYFLQYHIYTLALHLLLEQKLQEAYRYERDFGGVIYAFVRGVNGESYNGLHWDRLPYGLVADMKALMIEGQSIEDILS